MGGTAALIVAARVPGRRRDFRADRLPRSRRHVRLAGLAMPNSSSRPPTTHGRGRRQDLTVKADPKTIKIVPGSAHGTELLTTAQAGTVKEALHAFFLPHPVEP
jgi:hypothetical protein